MSGIKILVSDHHGVYVPQVFVESHDTVAWGLNEHDVSDVAGGPDNHEWYWEAWDYILAKANYNEDGHTWHLYQDGDLFAYCPELMTDEEYKDFFGEERDAA